MKLENYKNTIDELNTKALGYYEKGDLNNAAYYFEQLFVNDPYNKDTYFNLAKIYYEMNQNEKCINVLLGLLDLGDQDDSTYTLLGDAYIREEKYSEALLCYKKLLDNDAAEEKIKYIKELFKKKEDKIYMQYMNYPYPNTWGKNGIPQRFIEVSNYNGPKRRASMYLTQFLDINFIQLKYLSKYKSLSEIRVLNAGCGTGEGLLQQAILYPEVKFTGIDISEKSLGIAKKHAKKLKINNVTFLQRDISKLEKEDLGSFDIIISTGVLHHLYNPLEGFKRLKTLLKEDGLLCVMVYATIGRREVYDFRDIFSKLFSEAEQFDYKIHAAKDIMSSLQPWQSMNRIKLVPDLNFGDQGLVDLLLNENETSYTTRELMDLTSEAEMKIDFYHDNYLNPLFFIYNMNSDLLKERIKLLSMGEKIQIAEVLNGSILKHHFICYKDEFQPKENLLFSYSWLDTFPTLWNGVPLVKNGNEYYLDLKFRGGITDGVSRFIFTDENTDYLKYNLSEEEFVFLTNCFGKKSIREILEGMKEEFDVKEAKKLIFDLSKMEVLFLSEQKEEFYKG